MSPSMIAQRTNSVVHEMCNFFACLPHVHAMLHDTLLPSVILRQIFFLFQYRRCCRYVWSCLLVAKLLFYLM